MDHKYAAAATPTHRPQDPGLRLRRTRAMLTNMHTCFPNHSYGFEDVSITLRVTAPAGSSSSRPLAADDRPFAGLLGCKRGAPLTGLPGWLPDEAPPPEAREALPGCVGGVTRPAAMCGASSALSRPLQDKTGGTVSSRRNEQNAV